jgi:hypothetical protein
MGRRGVIQHRWDIAVNVPLGTPRMMLCVRGQRVERRRQDGYERIAPGAAVRTEKRHSAVGRDDSTHRTGQTVSVGVQRAEGACSRASPAWEGDTAIGRGGRWRMSARLQPSEKMRAIAAKNPGLGRLEERSGARVGEEGEAPARRGCLKTRVWLHKPNGTGSPAANRRPQTS